MSISKVENVSATAVELQFLPKEEVLFKGKLPILCCLYHLLPQVHLYLTITFFFIFCFTPLDFVTGQYNCQSKAVIKIVNPSSKKVVFKVMVTEPRRYLVRPNYGLLESSSCMEIKAKLRPLPSLEAFQQLLATKQKFLFKWRILEEDESDSVSLGSQKSGNRRLASLCENPRALVRRKQECLIKSSSTLNDFFS